MSEAIQVLAYGELLWDLLPSGPVLGGAPANLAYRCCELGKSAAIVSRIGNDEYGAKAKKTVEDSGVSVEFLESDPILPTGTVDVVLSESGQPSYTIVKGVAYDEIVGSASLLEAAEKASVVCFGTLVQRSAVSQECLFSVLEAGHKALRFVDINLRKDCYSASSLNESLKRSNWLKLNDEEVKVLASLLNLPSIDKDFASELIERYDLNGCVITYGERGARAISSSGEDVMAPGFKVQVIDTIGSGDAFSAAFVCSLLDGLDLKTACTRGNALGALAATMKGAMGAISASRIQSFLAAAEVE